MELQDSFERLRLRADRLFDESRDAMRESLVLRVQGQYIRQRVESGAAETVAVRPRQWAPPRPKSLNVLTPRERSVLELIVKGKSTREIAGVLKISFKTAACHRSAIMSKLAVHKSAALVREAYRLGLVGDQL
jgi:DNA-binding NarL/FixJ family response regulator